MTSFEGVFDFKMDDEGILAGEFLVDELDFQNRSAVTPILLLGREHSIDEGVELVVVGEDGGGEGGLVGHGDTFPMLFATSKR